MSNSRDRLKEEIQKIAGQMKTAKEQSDTEIKQAVEKAKKIIAQLSEYDVETESGTLLTVIDDLVGYLERIYWLRTNKQFQIKSE